MELVANVISIGVALFFILLGYRGAKSTFETLQRREAIIGSPVHEKELVFTMFCGMCAGLVLWGVISAS